MSAPMPERYLCANCGQPSGMLGHPDGSGGWACTPRIKPALGVDLFGRVSTADTGERSENDLYESPGWMTRSLLHHHPSIRGSVVLECCSGRDASAHVLRAYGCRVFTNDIDPRHPADSHFDATSLDYWSEMAPNVDWVITNVAFAVAFQILRLAVLHAKVGVAFVLRKSFTEPTEGRGAWLATYPPSRMICLPRHSYRGAGSDMVATDWMLWERRPDRRLDPIVIDDAADRRTRNEV
jgi:hypothetical protein